MHNRRLFLELDDFFFFYNSALDCLQYSSSSDHLPLQYERAKSVHPPFLSCCDQQESAAPKKPAENVVSLTATQNVLILANRYQKRDCLWMSSSFRTELRYGCFPPNLHDSPCRVDHFCQLYTLDSLQFCGVGMVLSTRGMQLNWAFFSGQAIFCDCFKHQILFFVFPAQTRRHDSSRSAKSSAEWTAVSRLFAQFLQAGRSNPPSHVQSCLPPPPEFRLLTPARIAEQHVRILLW